MTELDKLTELFMKFPGIGPRQARRFVFFLLRQDAGYRNTLAKAITEVASTIKQCESCLRYSTLLEAKCKICSDSSREKDQLMIVEKDTDIDQMEKSDSYKGMYFVLGGVMSLTGKKNYMREKELSEYFKKNKLKEIILALSTTTDGEYSTQYLFDKIKDSETLKGVKTTILGRGLSTGSELEYADAATLSQALKNRA